jgi:HJR/Mrr/RecB family endonuclease
MTLDPDAFECFCAALWAKLKFSAVYRTPKSGDGGIDVVAIRGREGVLIQCKSFGVEGQELGWNAIKDVVAGTAGYERRHRGVAFRMYAVTNQFFNETARRQALLNGVELIDQMALDELLKKNPISNLDLEQYLIPN